MLILTLLICYEPQHCPPDLLSVFSDLELLYTKTFAEQSISAMLRV